MSLIKANLLFVLLLIVCSCGLFDSDTLDNKYSDGNITIELFAGTPQKPGTIKITSSVEDTIRLPSLNIDECTFAYYSIEGMRYFQKSEKWKKGEINVSCDLYVPPLILLPMETKSIEIIPVLPEGKYKMHMYYSVDNSPDIELSTEVELGFRIRD